MSLAFTRTQAQTQNHTTSPMKSFFTSILTLACLTAFGQGFIDSLDYSSYDPMAQAEIAMIQDKFTQVSNPFVAEYLGSEFHDYFYFPFQSEDGMVFDFANQNNNLGDLPFSEADGQWEGSPGRHLVGRKFLLEWEYQRSHILCCEGQNNMYPAMLPRIKSIKLLEDL